jgi:hypothetical protein
MSTAKQILSRMVDELPDEIVPDIIIYIDFVRNAKKNAIFNDLEHASLSSTEFWNNPIDDEVWNNV